MPVWIFLCDLLQLVLQHPGNSSSTLGINTFHAFFFCTAASLQEAGLLAGVVDTGLRAPYQAVPSLLILSCQALPTTLSRASFAPLTHCI